MDLLRGEFGQHFISRSGPVYWLPKSCHLTPLGYFWRGCAKAHVYTDKPASIAALEDNIEAFIREIPAAMLVVIWTVLSYYIQIKISIIFLNFEFFCFFEKLPYSS